MSDAPVRGRALTVVAVGFLLLDGVLLLCAGLWGRQVSALIGGVLCLGAAGGERAGSAGGHAGSLPGGRRRRRYGTQANVEQG